MSYEPTNWKTGDVVTSAKLNKLENGVAGAGGTLVVHINIETGMFDTKAGIITNAIDNGVCVLILFSSEHYTTVFPAYMWALMPPDPDDDHAGQIKIVLYDFEDSSIINVYVATANDYPVWE